MENPNACNGWTNYETWRVNLELLDNYNEAYPEQIEEFAKSDDVGGLADQLEEYVDECLTGFGELKEEGMLAITIGYARAFTAEVNYHEISKHLIADWKRNEEYEENEAEKTKA